MLNELHALAAGNKAYYTWTAHHGIEMCRQHCGGAGFSEYSGLPSILKNYAAQVTYEGDNYVMT